MNAKTVHASLFTHQSWHTHGKKKGMCHDSFSCIYLCAFIFVCIHICVHSVTKKTHFAENIGLF